MFITHLWQLKTVFSALVSIHAVPLDNAFLTHLQKTLCLICAVPFGVSVGTKCPLPFYTRKYSSYREYKKLFLAFSRIEAKAEPAVVSDGLHVGSVDEVDVELADCLGADVEELKHVG